MNSFSLAPNRQKMAICCKELDSIKDIFNEKEKELAVAMSKVDALTRQLDELKDGNTMNSYNINMTNSSVNGLLNCQSSKFNIELEKLKQELLYRTKLNEKINEEMLLKQKQIDQRTIELNNIDQRIAELKNRLAKKRNLNKQLNDQMKNHLLKTENNQSKTLNDNPNNENDVPNCNSILKLNIRRSIGAGQSYKFTHLKQQNQTLKLFQAADVKRQPKSDLNLNTKLTTPINTSLNYNDNKLNSNELNEQQTIKSNDNLNDNQLNNLKIATIQNTNQIQETKLTSINVNNNEKLSDQNLLNNNQRINAITNTAKYLIVDQRQKELVSSNEHNDKNDLNDNFKTNLNSNLNDKFKSNNVNNNLKLNLNNSSLNNEQLNNSNNISPTISTASSSNVSSDYVPSNSSSNSDLVNCISSNHNSTYRFTNVQPIIQDSIENENVSKSVKQLKQNIEQSNQESSSINNLLINSKVPINTNQQNVFNTSNSDNNKLSNRLIVQTKQINKPDIIESSNVNTEDNTDFINSSSCNSMKTDLIINDSINNSNLPIDHLKSNSTIDNDKKQQFNFGLLQTSTSTPSKSNNTDSESDLSSETSTNISYKKSSTNLINKNNELNDNKRNLNNSYSNDLKISIDNSDWLRKRRPLIADLDLEEHFDKINDQLVYNSKTDKFNNEQSNKDDIHSNNKIDKKLDNLDMLSTSSSSNHSPNSLADELDANKIELRSVIRNIMCKNLGSSSDKSSSTMSEEEETDEDDENSVDCKAKINNIKPSSMKLKQTTNQNNRINSDDNELNKSKEISNHNNNKLKNNKLNLNDQYNDSADDKEDSDNQYDSNNSEERTDELSSKDDLSTVNLTTTNNLINDNHLKSNKIKSKSNLKKQSSKNKRRVSFDPLAILLDAALEGELDLVKKTATQVSNPSASFEGVTALHNSICAGHFEICTYLIQIGCDVNAQDHDGWTPLHCAASVGNLPIIKYLIEHGACIFSVTLSDHETPKQKCEEQEEDGFEGCLNYLQCMEEKLGTINGTVYAAYDYTAQQPDELNFKCNEQLRILDKSDDDDDEESEWWWSSNSQQQKGYVPRNLLSLYPRLIPMPKENYDD